MRRTMRTSRREHASGGQARAALCRCRSSDSIDVGPAGRPLAMMAVCLHGAPNPARLSRNLRHPPAPSLLPQGACGWQRAVAWRGLGLWPLQAPRLGPAAAVAQARRGGQRSQRALRRACSAPAAAPF